MSRTRPAPRRVHHRDPEPGHTRRPCPCAHRSPRTVRLQPPSTPPSVGGEAPNREVSNKKTKARARSGNHGARDPHATLINGLTRTKVTRRRRNGTHQDFPNHHCAARPHPANRTLLQPPWHPC